MLLQGGGSAAASSDHRRRPSALARPNRASGPESGVTSAARRLLINRSRRILTSRGAGHSLSAPFVRLSKSDSPGSEVFPGFGKFLPTASRLSLPDERPRALCTSVRFQPTQPFLCRWRSPAPASAAVRSRLPALFLSPGMTIAQPRRAPKGQGSAILPARGRETFGVTTSRGTRP